MAQQRLLVVVGSGPGIGVATASLFASKGFNIALISRNAERLKEDASKVQEAGGPAVRVETFAVDIGDSQRFQQTLHQIHKSMGSPEVVLWNAARIAMATIGEEDPELLLSDFKMMNVGQYIAATWALPLFTEMANQPDRHPTFLNSSSGVGSRPFPQLFGLCMQKAAQNNFLFSLGEVAGPKGIHVARVDINGVVADEEPVLNARNIAEQHWKLSQQDKKDWQSVIEVGSMEDFIKKMT